MARASVEKEEIKREKAPEKARDMGLDKEEEGERELGEKQKRVPEEV